VPDHVKEHGIKVIHKCTSVRLALHGALICASQVIGLIDDLPSGEELVQRMVTECRSALKEALAAT
jgi:hypothetical protein